MTFVVIIAAAGVLLLVIMMYACLVAGSQMDDVMEILWSRRRDLNNGKREIKNEEWHGMRC